VRRWELALGCALALWAALALIAGLWGAELNWSWPAWRFAFGAAALWGICWLLILRAAGPSRLMSEVPLLTGGVGLLMTLFGTGSYWATTQLYPTYRLPIEEAAWFVSCCMLVTLVALTASSASPAAKKERPRLEWDWPRLRALTFLLGGLAFVGTVGSLYRIGYVPILTGDPTSARVEFPVIGGAFYRLSMLGGVVALLVACQAAARRASLALWVIGGASLLMVGLYGPRFFVILPIAVGVLLWDRVRQALPLRRMLIAALVTIPLLAMAGYWRERETGVALLGPVGVLFYGTLGEFRDLAWTLNFYGTGQHFLQGATLGSLVVPILPTPFWTLLGIDKGAVYANSSAAILGDQMGQSTGQRIGAYGEFYMNFGWTGALIGAALYGLLLGYLHARFREARAQEVRSLLLALAIATAIFAQLGQLNMFTSTLTGLGYPILGVALLAAHRPVSRSPAKA